MSVYTARRITLGATVAITVDAFGAIFDGAGVAQVCGYTAPCFLFPSRLSSLWTLFAFPLDSLCLPSPPRHPTENISHHHIAHIKLPPTQFQMFTACGTKADLASPTVYYGRAADAPSVDDCMLQYALSLGALRGYGRFFPYRALPFSYPQSQPALAT